MIDPIWREASYECARRMARVNDRPVALLLSSEDGSGLCERLVEHCRLLWVERAGVIVDFPIPPGALCMFEGSPVYTVPWIKSGEFAWAWPKLPS